MTATISPRATSIRNGTHRDGRGLAIAVLALGAGLALNTVLGPLLIDTIRYPFSESLRNQTIGLEAVSLFLVTPLCVVSASLIWRGRLAGPVLAFGPATYAAYMLVQYLIGPGYLSYPRVLPLHLGLFILSVGVAVAAWSRVDASALPTMTDRVARRRANVMLLLAAFIVSRYLPALAGSWSQHAIAPEFAREPGMFWTILVLDLGLIVPAAVSVALALRRDAPQAAESLYALVGWFALVPPSVAAMATVMVVNDDPNKSMASVLLFVAGAIAFGAYAFAVVRPLLRGDAGSEASAASGVTAGS